MVERGESWRGTREPPVRLLTYKRRSQQTVDSSCWLLTNRDCFSYTSLERKRTPLGPYRRPIPRVQGGSWGGGAFSYGRGTPVEYFDEWWKGENLGGEHESLPYDS